ncbi:MAG: pantetheine-phosphate adenylyltransferase [Bacteroidetes bacterium]|jgi:pantetheine-phosphate adenylyltransferase|nr:MAG: pantetheine-phosphate adenylyltransferase [Bacteroidota bacterium]
MNSIALFPGSFDPPTLGHLNMIGRACSQFDRVLVGIGVNHRKTGLFTVEERKELLTDLLQDPSFEGRVSVEIFSGLMVEFARQQGVRTIVRGLRQVSDFEFEYRMALTNRRLTPDIDTLFLMPDEPHTFVSATLVREVAQFGGDLSSFVPEAVADALRKKFFSDNS